MTGLCSVTFRHLNVDQIIEFALKANLNRIEWGADIHVPSGEYDTAKEVCEKMEKANLTTTAYGSYYKLGEHEEYYALFSSLVETALILKAPRIRIWAGSMASSKVSPSRCDEMVDELKEICEMAEKKGLSVALEFHRNSLNDNAQSCINIIKKAKCPNLTTYWQITPSLEHQKRVEELKAIKHNVSCIHVFYWGENNIRFPLKDADKMWQEYKEIVKDKEIDYLLEFVKDDMVEQGIKDAKYLNWLVKDIK